MTKFEMTQLYSATWPASWYYGATYPPVGETNTERNHQKSEGAASAVIR